MCGLFYQSTLSREEERYERGASSMCGVENVSWNRLAGQIKQVVIPERERERERERKRESVCLPLNTCSL